MIDMFLEGIELYNEAETRTSLKSFGTPLRIEIAKILTAGKGANSFEKTEVKDILDNVNFKKILPPELSKLLDRQNISEKQAKTGAIAISNFIKETDIEQRKRFNDLLNEMRGTVKRKMIHQYPTAKIKNIGDSITEFIDSSPELIKDNVIKLAFNPEGDDSTTKFMNEIILKLSTEAEANAQQSNTPKLKQISKLFNELAHANILWPQADYPIMNVGGLKKYFRELLTLDKKMKKMISSYKTLKIDAENDSAVSVKIFSEAEVKQLIKKEISQYIKEKGKLQEPDTLVKDFNALAEKLINNTPGLEDYFEKEFSSADGIGELSTILFQTYKKFGMSQD